MMPPPKPKGILKGGPQILGLPWWAWGGAALAGLVIGFVFLRRKGGDVPSMIGQSSPVDAAGAGQPRENGAPAEGLSADVLAALGYLAEGQATIGGTLAQILAGGGNTATGGAELGYTAPAPVLTSAAPIGGTTQPLATQLSQLNPSGTSWLAPVPGSASAASLASTPFWPAPLTPQAAASVAQGIAQFTGQATPKSTPTPAGPKQGSNGGGGRPLYTQ